MEDTAKYLIHANIVAEGVVERSDVVGAIFGQTEGLLGDELDLRDLQQSSKVGRIDVQIASENGRSTGEVTIATSMDKVETAILAASLETISRVGPCTAELVVTDIEDVREAKRRQVVERAKELLATNFDGSVMTSAEILEEVREAVRVEDITEYRGLPAGPRVLDSDAIVVVEGRADVLQLLRYGIKNAIAVEGTDVPEAVAELTQERHVTAFLDGDRGGELVLRELAQVGDVDHVAFAPEGQSVEDLPRHAVLSALRDKVPFDSLPAEGSLRAAVAGDVEGNAHGESAATDAAELPDRADVAASDGEPTETEPTGGDAKSVETADVDGDDPAEPSPEGGTEDPETATADAVPTGDGASRRTADAASGGDLVDGREDTTGGAAGEAGDGDTGHDGATVDDADGATSAGRDTVDDDLDDGKAEATDAGEETVGGDEGDDRATEGPATLREHVEAVVDARNGTARLVTEGMTVVAEVPAGEAFDALLDAADPPYALILDGELTQRVLDVAAQRGVNHVVARSSGEFVKKPVDVRVRTAAQVAAQ